MDAKKAARDTERPSREHPFGSVALALDLVSRHCGTDYMDFERGRKHDFSTLHKSAIRIAIVEVLA
jgi:hypothetical protein